MVKDTKVHDGVKAYVPGGLASEAVSPSVFQGCCLFSLFETFLPLVSGAAKKKKNVKPHEEMLLSEVVRATTLFID